MIKELIMHPHNQQVYLAIVKDMELHENGLFSFVLRINDGAIVDYVKMDNIPPDAFDESIIIEVPLKTGDSSPKS